MADVPESCPEGWQEQPRPLAWNRRFEFNDYAQTRRFLDLLAEVSAASGHYPSLNFARTHVVVTIQFEGGGVDPALRALAQAADECARRVRG